MKDLDALLTIAEVAVAFAGFASIVSVLGRRSDRDISRFNRAALRGMIFCSLAVVFCAFAPLVPLRFGLESLLAWRLSSLFLLAVSVALFLAGLQDGRRLRQAGVPLGMRLSAAIPLIAVAALAAAAAAGLGGKTPALYLLALLLLLAIAGLLFSGILLTFLTPRSSK